MIIILFFIILTPLYGNSIYFSMDPNSNDYEFIEYNIIANNSYDNLFIFSQPYKSSEIDKILLNSKHKKSFIEKNLILENIIQREVNFMLYPGFTLSDSIGFKPYAGVASLISFDNTYLKIHTDFDKRFISDEYFHGDKESILTGHIRDSYMLTNYNNLEFFAGRVNRNFGIVNEYSLIFSNNPYSFDHYGMILSGQKTQFSFFISRLNDKIDAMDSQGIVIPADSTQNSKRFFGFQNIDLKISEKFQCSFSQSVIYGGPNQSFEGPFMNPVNFFYADQRNSNIQMNVLLKLSLLYNIFNKNSIFFELLVDDYILNNDHPNETLESPHRLGFISKYSIADFFIKESLLSLVYTKISNQTYTSFRDYENYTYQLKGIGYPYNSYESIKSSLSLFEFYPSTIKFDLELSRNGDSNLENIFVDEKYSFPLDPILYACDVSTEISFYLFSRLDIYYNLSYRIHKFNDSLSAEENLKHNFKLNYTF